MCTFAINLNPISIIKDKILSLPCTIGGKKPQTTPNQQLLLRKKQNLVSFLDCSLAKSMGRLFAVSDGLFSICTYLDRLKRRQRRWLWQLRTMLLRWSAGVILALSASVILPYAGAWSGRLIRSLLTLSFALFCNACCLLENYLIFHPSGTGFNAALLLCYC